MQGRFNLGLGSAKVNGLIEEYKVISGGNINAGDFVKFVNKIDGEWTDNILLNYTKSGQFFEAIALNDNYVFIAHYLDSGGNNRICVTLVKVEDTSITLISDTVLSSESTFFTNDSKSISLVKIAENQVFITFCQGTSSQSSHIYGIKCSIDNEVLNVGIKTQICSANYASVFIKSILLSENKILILHTHGISSHLYASLYGIVCDIDNTLITVGNDTLISSYTYSGYVMSTVTIYDNKAFIAFYNHNNGTSSAILCGAIALIEDKEITIKPSKNIISTPTYQQIPNLVYINENKIFMAFIKGDSSGLLSGIIISIVNDDFAVGTVTQLNSSQLSRTASYSTVLLDSEKLFIAYNDTSNSKTLRGLMISIQNDNITVIEDNKLSDNSNSANTLSTVLLKNNIIIVHSNTSDYFMNLMTNGLETSINHLTSKYDTIFGVAKTSGGSNQAIKVYVPNIIEGE